MPKPKTAPTRGGTRLPKLLDTIRIRGLDVTVLEIKGNNATVQLDDGSKLIVPLQECVTASHGGGRPGAGRPRKEDRDAWAQITCTLRKDTIERLRKGSANGRFFGEFLQFHLDRFPLPTHEQYLLIKRHRIKAPKTRALLARKEEQTRLSEGEKQLSYTDQLKLYFERSGGPDNGGKDKVSDTQRIANLTALGLNKRQIAERLGLTRKQLAERWNPLVKAQPSFVKEVA